MGKKSHRSSGKLAASLQAFLKAGSKRSPAPATPGSGNARPLPVLGKITAQKAGKASSLSSLQRLMRHADQERKAAQQALDATTAQEAKARADARESKPPDLALRQRYLPDRHILLVGEGNLSFSLALARLWAEAEGATTAAEDATMPAERLIATVYDSQQALATKYSDASANADELRALGATVVYGVDATQLDTPAQIALHGLGGPGGPVADLVAFHFPHAGLGIKDQDRNIRENQKLLQAFFMSVQGVLARGVGAASVKRPRRPDDDDDDGAKEDGKVADRRRRRENGKRGHGQQGGAKAATGVGSEAGDGGGEVHVTVRRGEPYDQWQVVKLARSAGLALINAIRFDPRAFPGYEHRRTIGTVQGISNLHNEEILPKTCVTYIFQRAAPKPTA